MDSQMRLSVSERRHIMSAAISAVKDVLLEESPQYLSKIASRVTGRTLYIGQEEELLPDALKDLGHDITIWNWPQADIEAAAEFNGDWISMPGAKFESEFNTVIVSSLTFNHLPGVEVHRSLFAELAHRLEPGGLIIIDEVRWRSNRFTPLILPDVYLTINDVKRVGSLKLSQSPTSTCLVACMTYKVSEQIDVCEESFSLQLYPHRMMAQNLAAVGFVAIDRSSESGEALLNVIHRFRRTAEYPLCHPFGMLTLGSIDNPALVITKGLGCTVWDDRGKEYIDASGGLWNTHVGLGNLEIIDAISQQATKLSYSSLFSERSNEPAIALAKELRSLAPHSLQWVYLTSSGSESTEVSLRLALLYHVLRGRPEKKHVIYLDESYHGTFFGSISVSGLMPLRELYQSGVIHTSSVPTPNPLKCSSDDSYLDFVHKCADALELRAQASDVAAIILEPILGSAGVLVLPPEYVDRVKTICSDHDILLIVDEVATGFGRTGKWFASEHYDLDPDVMLLAKGINSGYLPLGAMLFSAKIGEAFAKSGMPIMHGSTYNGHPVCCASAIANIEVIKRDRLVERSEEMGKYFLSKLRDLVRIGYAKEARGRGLMLALVIPSEGAGSAAGPNISAIAKSLEEEGILTYPSSCALIFCPALIITEEEIDQIVRALHAVLGKLKLNAGEIEPRESGAPG